MTRQSEGARGNQLISPTGLDRKSVSSISSIFKDYPHALKTELLRQLQAADPLAAGMNDAEYQNRFDALISLLSGIDPKDPIEAALAVEMVSTHNTAMHLLERANAPNQHFKAQDYCLKAYEKFSKLYMRQMEALKKHRTNGSQNIKVGHLEVTDGSQAIVGHVNAGVKKGPTHAQPDCGPKAIENNPGEILDTATDNTHLNGQQQSER